MHICTCVCLLERTVTTERTVRVEGYEGTRLGDGEQCCSRAGIRNHLVMLRTVRLKDGQELRWLCL